VIGEQVFFNHKLRSPYRFHGNELICEADAAVRVPIRGGIPRFVDGANYAESFGEQWHRYADVQIDSHTGTRLSEQRFYQFTRWTKAELRGARILEVGCGAGRFTEVMLSAGAQVYSLDYSSAAEVALANNRQHAERLCMIQADLYDIPFPAEYFDYVFCFGVLQHTPDPHQAFLSITKYLKPGGRIAIDCYLKDGRIRPWKSKYLWRSLTTRLPREQLFRLVEWYVPRWLPIDTALYRIPKLGVLLRSFIPCFNWTVPGLPKEQVVARSILDTFDALSAAYDKPQTLRAVRRWCVEAGLNEVVVEEGSNGLVALAVR
jgi:SAM-dependent methyltransferase